MTARMSKRDGTYAVAVRLPYASTPSPLPPTYTGVTDAAASGGAGTRPSVPGPRAVGTHATATHLAILTRGSTGASFERQQMQPYLRYGWPSTSTAARLDLRTASRAYPRINSDAAAQQHRPGFLWEPTACPTCVGSPSLDVWHAVAECPSLDWGTTRGPSSGRRGSDSVSVWPHPSPGACVCRRCSYATHGIWAHFHLHGNTGWRYHSGGGRTKMRPPTLVGSVPRSTAITVGRAASGIRAVRCDHDHVPSFCTGSEGSGAPYRRVGRTVRQRHCVMAVVCTGRGGEILPPCLSTALHVLHLSTGREGVW